MAEMGEISFERLPLQAKLRIDAVCARFEAAWSSGRPRLESFCAEAPDVEQSILLAELLYIEVECRRRAGEIPRLADYLPRLPEHEYLLREVLPDESKPESLPTGERQETVGPHDSGKVGVVSGPPGSMSVPGYEVFEELGRGGMGFVHKARHVALNRLVALKFILAARQGELRQRVRFRREAEVIARLRHPNIIQIYDIGEVGGRHYLALEYADAGSLRDRLSGTPLEPRQAAMVLEPLARAVQHAHRQGVIHRDIKPANILLATGGDSLMHGHRDLIESYLLEVPHHAEHRPIISFTPKLTDFGLAQLVDHNGVGEAGLPAGTPSYMAPEQVTGEANCGPTGDVWALGATLYELLTGRPPFRAATAAETLRLVLNAEPVSPCQLQPSIPRDLETICLKCLQKEPSQRYPGARELAQDLRRFLAGQSILAQRAGPGTRLRKWARRKPATAAWLVLLGVGLLGGLAAGSVALLHAVAGWRSAEITTQTALQELVQAREAHHRAEDQTLRSRRQLARSLFGRAQQAGAQGHAGEALHLLLSAYRAAPQADESFRRLVRVNLGGWSEYVHALDHPVAVEESARCLAVDPRGNFLLTATADQQIFRRDLKTGKRIGEPWSLRGPARLILFSPDGSKVLVGEGNADAETGFSVARLHDAITGQVVGGELVDPAGFTQVAFSSEGRLVSGSQDGSVRLWSRDGQAIGSARKHPHPVRRLSVSADGRQLAVALGAGPGKPDAVWCHDLAQEKRRPQILPHPAAVTALAFQPGTDLLLTACGDGLVRTWDVKTGLVWSTSLVHPGTVEHLHPGAGGRLVLTSTSQDVTRLWDHATGRLLGVLPGGRTGSGIGADRRLWVSGNDEVRVYRCGRSAALPALPAGRPFSPVYSPVVPSASAIAYFPDGKKVLHAETALGRAEGLAWISALDAQTPRVALRHRYCRVEHVALDPTGKLAATASTLANSGSAVRLWDVETGKPRGSALEVPQPVRALAISPDGQILAADGAQVLRWRVSGESLPTLHLGGAVTALAVHPDGQTLAVGAAGSPGADGNITFWDLKKGTQQERRFPHVGPVERLTFSPDGTLLLAAGSSARLWSLTEGRPLGQLYRNHCASLLAADGKSLIVACRDGSICQYETSASKPRLKLVHPRQAQSLDLSTDGQLLLVGGSDGTAQLWDISGRPLAVGPPVLVGAPVLALRLAADGQSFCTTGAHGITQTWAVPPPCNGTVEQMQSWVETLTGRRGDEFVSP